jgi:hypothetical protein
VLELLKESALWLEEVQCPLGYGLDKERKLDRWDKVIALEKVAKKTFRLFWVCKQQATISLLKR